MPSYKVFNLRMLQVGVVDTDKDEAEAMKIAKAKYGPGVALERIQSAEERRTKQYQDEVDLWNALHRHRH